MKRLKSFIQLFTKQTVVAEEVITMMVKDGLGRPKNNLIRSILVILYCLIKILLIKTELLYIRMILRISKKLNFHLVS
jgi:hypothetical protein